MSVDELTFPFGNGDKLTIVLKGSFSAEEASVSARELNAAEKTRFLKMLEEKLEHKLSDFGGVRLVDRDNEPTELVQSGMQFTVSGTWLSEDDALTFALIDQYNKVRPVEAKKTVPTDGTPAYYEFSGGVFHALLWAVDTGEELEVESTPDPVPTDPGNPEVQTADVSDPTADVETAADWEKMFEDLKISGHYAFDLVKVAGTQIDYSASTKNFEIRNGVKHGYTRYGAWYGDPYGEWDTAFVSFCLNYAGVPKTAFPYGAACQSWIGELKNAGRYADGRSLSDDTGEWQYYSPKAGDVAFIDLDGDGAADHAAILSKPALSEKGEVIGFRAIEAGRDGRVEEKAYSITDGRICGYGVMPEKRPEQTLNAQAGMLKLTIRVPAGGLPAASRAALTELTDEALQNRLAEAAETSISEAFAAKLRYFDVFSRVSQPTDSVEIKATSPLLEKDGAVLLFRIDADGSISLLHRFAEDDESFVFEESEEASYAVALEVPASEGDGIVAIPENANEPLLRRSALSPMTLLALEDNADRGDAPARESATVDYQTIESISIQWLSRSAGESEPAGQSTLRLLPTSDLVPSHQFQIDFALSGEKDHAPGSIEIVIPAYIWQGRNGQELGSLSLGFPAEPNQSNGFSWTRVNNKIVLTNVQTVPAASSIFFQGTFKNLKAHEIEDKDEDESAALNAVITLTAESGESVTLTSNTIRASLDTHAAIANAVKSARDTSGGGYYAFFNAEYKTDTRTFEMTPPSILPDNLKNVLVTLGKRPEDYGYVRWYVTGTAEGNQPYTMTLSDSVPEDDTSGCILLGVEDVNGENIASTDGKSISVDLLSMDYRPMSASNSTQITQSAFVWTAYPFSSFEQGQVYTLSNTASVTVTSQDDQETTTIKPKATVDVKLPTIYHFKKEWDDDNDVRGLRPKILYIWIFRDGSSWLKIPLDEEHYNWEYTWSDEGIAYEY